MTRRWPGVLSRVFAAVLGGYGLAALLAACCAVALPLAPAEAVLTGMLLGFPVQAGAAIWVFAARGPARAWAGLALPAVASGGVLLVARLIAGA